MDASVSATLPPPYQSLEVLSAGAVQEPQHRPPLTHKTTYMHTLTDVQP